MGIRNTIDKSAGEDPMYFIKHAHKLYELMHTDFGLKVRTVRYVLSARCGRVDDVFSDVQQGVSIDMNL